LTGLDENRYRIAWLCRVELTQVLKTEWNQIMKKMLWIPVSASLLFSVGCGDSPKTADGPAPLGASSSLSNSLASAKPTAQAKSQVQLPSDPKEVVQLFLDSMRQGNGAQLSALMTTGAREEIKRKELVIDPLGSPLATFKIGEAAQQEDAMLVSSVWTEPGENGSDAPEIEVVWELRKEAAGWRVCGMAVDPMTGDEVQVVNFESMEPDSVKSEMEPQRVASLPNVSLPNVLPGALPSVQNPNSSAPIFPASVPSGPLPPIQSGASQGSFTLPPATSLPPASNLPPASSSGLPTGSGFGPR